MQGVGFRDWTQRRARVLALDGWVRNRSDGTVEALFSGARTRVEGMLEECRSGPPAASVSSVEVAAVEEDLPGPGFQLRY